MRKRQQRMRINEGNNITALILKHELMDGDEKIKEKN